MGFTYAYAEQPALVGIDLQLEEGRLHGVVGLNSSGKTTLCSLIRGVIPHFHHGDLTGEVVILGRPLLDWDPAELSRTIGCVFDNPFTQISGIRETVFEEIAIGLENLGVPRDEMIERVESVVEQLGIEAIVEKNPNELSGGQRQKVAFASIIAMDAPVVVIDEPTSQLDPEASEAVFEIIEGLKHRGKSIVLAEHKIDLLAQYADTITVMNEGTVVMHGPTRDVVGSDEFGAYGVVPPEVTELGRRLAAAGKPLDRLPIKRAEAFDEISVRIGRSTHAH
ncbi:energy-coupling factor ABC transporter ATP-binding protein [Micromonospora sp. CB01531]|uniref:energy-coupling factor ABC transporter ATP-binding protein n=1 Tax=Micromonospora sp. CB01531 TaxID=1718947 RepID=UPI0018EA0730|nr:ABC transporter ATP-binding protein [Micromonospora sp. CB01531]